MSLPYDLILRLLVTNAAATTRNRLAGVWSTIGYEEKAIAVTNLGQASGSPAGWMWSIRAEWQLKSQQRSLHAFANQQQGLSSTANGRPIESRVLTAKART